MAALLALLEPKERTKARHQPIILILDEFDLFALHPRQSFLYCLLDIVQGNRRKAGLGIIGLSARTVSSIGYNHIPWVAVLTNYRIACLCSRSESNLAVSHKCTRLLLQTRGKRT